MFNNLDLNSASLSNDQTNMRATDQEFALEIGLEDGMDAPSMWDGASETEQGNDMMTNWEGRQETHQMFLQSYD